MESLPERIATVSFNRISHAPEKYPETRIGFLLRLPL